MQYCQQEFHSILKKEKRRPSYNDLNLKKNQNTNKRELSEARKMFTKYKKIENWKKKSKNPLEFCAGCRRNKTE